MSDGRESSVQPLRPGLHAGMEMAPTDGTPILAFVPTYYQGKGGWIIAVWLGEKGMRAAGWMDNRAWLVKPIYWMPLPPDPRSEWEAGK